MVTNDIKEGMEIELTHGRKGVMRDNKRGIIRTVEVEVPGQGTDIGSCYINEILFVLVDGKPVLNELTDAHKKKLANIGGW